MMKNHDVAIVGGGMVGLTTALCLADLSLSVVVIDAGNEPTAVEGDYTLRVSALNHATETLLRDLKCFPNGTRQAQYQGMYVWDKDSFSDISFDATHYGYQHLGTIIENDDIRYNLWQRVIEHPNIQTCFGHAIQQWAHGDQQSFITLSNGEMFTAKLVVGADGGESFVRKKAGFALTHWDYDHHATVATVRCQQPHQGVARQVFTPEGPLALLPLSEPNTCSIVWSQNTDAALSLDTLDDDAFQQSLSVAFDMKLGTTALISPRVRVPLKMRYAQQWVKQGIALVGDAAHTFHPLAGLGANVGFMDAAALAQVIQQAIANNHDPFSHDVLRRYERWRKSEAVKTIALMESFKRLFDGQNPFKKLVRGLGMAGVNKLPSIKQSLVFDAMGISGELPERAKTIQD